MKFIDMIDPVSDIHVGSATVMHDVASEGGGTNAVLRVVGNMEVPRDFGKLGILNNVHLTIWGTVKPKQKAINLHWDYTVNIITAK